MLCTKIVLNVRNNFCTQTQHVLPRFELGFFMYWTCNSMNNLSSYCGLVDAKIRASDKDLPVLGTFFDFKSNLEWCGLVKGHACTSCILVRHGSYHKANLFFRPFLELKLYLQYKNNFYIRSSSTTFTEATHFWLWAQLRIRILKIY